MLINLLKKLFNYTNSQDKSNNPKISKVMRFCLNPGCIFPLNIYGNIDNKTIEMILKNLDYEGPRITLESMHSDNKDIDDCLSYGDIAQLLEETFIKNRIKCKEIDEFHKSQKLELKKIQESNRNISDMYIPRFLSVEDMETFIKYYGIELNNAIIKIPHSAITFYINREKVVNCTIKIDRDEFNSNKLEFLVNKKIMIPAKKSKVEYLLMSLKIVELKDLAKKFKLKVPGNKIDLVNRLKEIDNILDVLCEINNYENHFVLLKPSDIDIPNSDFEDLVNFYKVNRIVCRLLTNTYRDSKRSLRTYSQLKYAGVEYFMIFNDCCKCPSQFLNEVNIKLEKESFPPYFIGCSCDAVIGKLK